jgi:hypothetical protein
LFLGFARTPNANDADCFAPFGDDRRPCLSIYMPDDELAKFTWLMRFERDNRAVPKRDSLPKANPMFSLVAIALGGIPFKFHFENVRTDSSKGKWLIHRYARSVGRNQTLDNSRSKRPLTRRMAALWSLRRRFFLAVFA